MIDTPRGATTPTQSDELVTADLIRRSIEEIRRFRSGEPSSDRFCLALLHRALVDRDEAAWEGVYVTLEPMVRIWARRIATDADDVDSVLNMAFTRLWQALDAERFARFADLAQVLQYLKLCVRSATLDRRRADVQSALHESLDVALARERVPDPSEAHDATQRLVTRESQTELWAMLRAHLHGEREESLIRLAFFEGLPPREISRCLPHLFPTVDDVYRLRVTVFDRLRQSHDLHQWRRAR
jgi:DNA-directed RNA polymerase specialized sigma24 family protein